VEEVTHNLYIENPVFGNTSVPSFVVRSARSKACVINAKKDFRWNSSKQLSQNISSPFCAAETVIWQPQRGVERDTSFARRSKACASRNISLGHFVYGNLYFVQNMLEVRLLPEILDQIDLHLKIMNTTFLCIMFPPPILSPLHSTVGGLYHVCLYFCWNWTWKTALLLLCCKSSHSLGVITQGPRHKPRAYQTQRHVYLSKQRDMVHVCPWLGSWRLF